MIHVIWYSIFYSFFSLILKVIKIKFINNGFKITIIDYNHHDVWNTENILRLYAPTDSKILTL